MTPRIPTRAVYSAVERLSSTNRLRVLAYHGVEDCEPFTRQLEVLARDWRPVSAAEVLAALRSGSRLPDRAVWVTFDDGLRSTIVGGLPILDRFGIKATAFVNPGVIEDSGVQWWEVIAASEGDERVRQLKRVLDDERRNAVSDSTELLPAGLERTVASRSELDHWIASGHTVGNHTWDHPVLDQCEPNAQIDQIRLADEWLISSGLMTDRLFAYPNGDFTTDSSQYLVAAGYEAVLLFDHRLARIDRGPVISRLRVDADASLERFGAILSGAHSGGYSVARRLGLRR